MLLEKEKKPDQITSFSKASFLCRLMKAMMTEMIMTIQH